jgi:uncharacterized membrane protein (UPF0127 family)
MNKLKFAGIFMAVIFIAAGCNKQPSAGTTTLKVGGSTLQVEIADTDTLRSLGLGNRDSLSPDSGMLFIFPLAGKYDFWMKGMRFDLDFIWIKDGRVAEITSNVPAEPNVPDDQLKRYSAQMEINEVLEVPSGYVASHNIQAGEIVARQ